MNIDWDKQPAEFPLWLEGTNEEHRKHSGWYRDAGQVFEGAYGGQWRACREGQFFTVHHKPEFAELAVKVLPPIESTVRIVTGGVVIWKEAERFIGADCTLKAVFMTGEQSMVAVEHQEDLVCCCFRAEMVRTPEQAKAEERMNKAIALYTAVMSHPGSSLWHRLDSERQEHFLSLVDAGWQQVKP